MLPKILRYEDPFFENTGEPRVQLLEPFRNKSGFYKFACEEVNNYLATVKPSPGKRYVLVLAMSASEYYGPNRNGDAFSERPVKVNGAWAVAPGETLVDHYKTFETHAHCYRHHINKDPAKKLGDVVKAFYNYKMHRVELLLEVDEEKGQDIVVKLDDGDFPGVSMGCRIRYDVCSICGNKAPTLDHYCDHVSGKNPDYGLNQLLPDGRRCFVWNPSPTLFDISFVFRPADRIGFTMQKVAYSNPYSLRMSAKLGSEVELKRSKRASLLKLSAIDKIIHGEVVDPEKAGLGKNEVEAAKKLFIEVIPRIIPKMEEFPRETLDELSRHSMSGILSSLNVCGIVPSASEIYYIVAKQHGIVPSGDIASKIVDTQGVLAEALASSPDSLDILEDLGIVALLEEKIIPEIVSLVTPFMEKRALWKEHLANRYIPESVGVPLAAGTGLFDADRTYYTPRLKRLHYKDPSSGKVYQTTLDAASKASLDNAKKSVIEGVGVAALTALGAKAVGASRKWRWLAPGVVGLGIGGGRALHRAHTVPGVDTVEGFRVPANTEFVEKRGQIEDPLLLASMLMAQDKIGQTTFHTKTSSHNVDTLYSKSYPDNSKLRRTLKQAMISLTEESTADSLYTGSVPFSKLAYTIGHFIVHS